MDEALAMQLLEEIGSFAEVACHTSMVEQENWNAQWEQDYPKVEVRDQRALRCTIRAVPCTCSRRDGRGGVPADELGTGHHATTHHDGVHVGTSLEGQVVLDMGCGTGCWPSLPGLQKPSLSLGSTLRPMP